MALKNFFRELAIKQAPKQEQLVDAVTEEAPILATMPTQASSNGLQHIYDEVKAIDGAQFVGLDEALPSIGVDSELQSVDLSVLGGKQQVGEDKALKMGGPAAYFAGVMPSVLRDTGSSTEQSILYNNIRAYAIANSKLATAGGSNSGAMYSMLCVKWVPGETTMLFDSSGLGNGKVFDIEPISSGSLYLNSDDVLVYGQRIKTYLGVLLANARNVSGIANIDLAASGSTDSGFVKLPTAIQIDQMIRAARGNPANTFIYCHPAVKDALNYYKDSKLQLGVFDKDLDRMIDLWNNIRIITSFNFLETEATFTA